MLHNGLPDPMSAETPRAPGFNSNNLKPFGVENLAATLIYTPVTANGSMKLPFRIAARGENYKGLKKLAIQFYFESAVHRPPPRLAINEPCPSKG